MKIALLGAESTGKTQLALALAGHWRAQGQSAIVVTEVLREWCDREGRTPRPHEQEGIAREQARRVDEASASDWLIADTTPLMIAIYSDMLFGDGALHEFAFEHQRRYDLTLVTGLDLPWVADGHQRDGPHVREPVDARVRAALQRAGVPFRVVYGTGPDRLANALAAIAAGRPQPGTEWRWACDKCSDPDCEHRLFSSKLVPPPPSR
jgi:nicotinamide riboside kinase